MKTVWTLFLIFASFVTVAGEIDSIGLISVIPYERPSSSFQNFKSEFKVGIGDLIDIDVSKEVKIK